VDASPRYLANVISLRLATLLSMTLLVLVYLLSGCGFVEWRDRTLRDVAEGRSHLDVSQIPPAGSGPSQTIEFRDNSGRTVGYGRVQGGTVNLYGPDGSRLGSGRR
jgi:hypothetical protein